MNTECGIYSCLSLDNINVKTVIDSFKNLQHRGQDGFGISWINNDNLNIIKQKGLIELNENFTSTSFLCHTRYSTTHKTLNCLQPIYSNKYDFSLAHNGNIPLEQWNKFDYRNYMTDSQNIVLYLESLLEKKTLIEALQQFSREFKSCFNIVIQTKNSILILKDRYGLRPLMIGLYNNKICISSESVALKGELKSTYEVKPSEILEINAKTLNIKTIQSLPFKYNICVFEYIYFMRQQSWIGTQVRIKDFRENLINNIEKYPISSVIKEEKCLISGVPKTGNEYGIKLSKILNLEYKQFIEKKEKKRTFILENNKKRLDACKKTYIIDNVIKNRNIVIVDDSIVRGNTIRTLIELIKLNKPKNIHIIIASPEIKHPCYYGVDFPDIEDLISNKYNSEEYAKSLNITSLTFLDIKDLPDKNFCDACFTGNYLR